MSQQLLREDLQKYRISGLVPSTRRALYSELSIASGCLASSESHLRESASCLYFYLRVVVFQWLRYWSAGTIKSGPPACTLASHYWVWRCWDDDSDLNKWLRTQPMGCEVPPQGCSAPSNCEDLVLHRASSITLNWLKNIRGTTRKSWTQWQDKEICTDHLDLLHATKGTRWCKCDNRSHLSSTINIGTYQKPKAALYTRP